MVVFINKNNFQYQLTIKMLLYRENMAYFLKFYMIYNIISLITICIKII